MFDDLPYAVHTGNELALMLAGTKPLAFFYDGYPAASDQDDDPDGDIIPERLFDPHVASGLFEKREYVELDPKPMWYDGRLLRGLRIVLYARTGEAWRIDAFILMHEIGRRDRWNDSLERLTGALLGYESWQNDAWLARERRHRAAWGGFTVYLSVGKTELLAIHNAGYRALPATAGADSIELVARMTRPNDAEAQQMILRSNGCALVRFAVLTRFLSRRAGHGNEENACRYAIRVDEIAELNRHIISAIEPVARRDC